MQAETARMLLGSIATTTAMAIENQNKLMALEAELQKSEPQLFKAYQGSLEEVRRKSPASSEFPNLLSAQD